MSIFSVPFISARRQSALIESVGERSVTEIWGSQAALASRLNSRKNPLGLHKFRPVCLGPKYFTLALKLHPQGLFSQRT